ncbi:ABC transporter permease [Bacillus sinesaloumensis]|uniref:ABC transporter permease n=1 Tax=Litchfieldia sinesaloumensis TaxID=1926280 RepID=UPI00098889E2|nr:ABC transporter permease [Bacillus sinesaloumensis]
MSNRLFTTRLRKEIAYQWGVFKSVVDWIIFLYLFIPALAIGGYHYYHWWLQVPGWMEGLPFQLVITLLYLVCWQGHIRTFLEDADQLFLLQKRSLIIGLKKSTRNLFVIGFSVALLLLIGILAPILFNHYNLSLIEVIILSFYFISLKALILGGKQYLEDMTSPWKKGFISVILFVALGLLTISLVTWSIDNFPIILLIFSLLQWGVYQVYSSRKLKKLTTFSKDVDMEKLIKLKYVSSIFLLSEYVEKVPSQKKKSPLFYRRSKRIYKNRNRSRSLQELFLKVFFRNKMYLLQCFQIVGVTTGALLIIPPMWIKLTVFICFIIVLRLWVKLVYKRTMSNHFIVTLRKDDSIWYQTENYSVNIISLPVISIVGLLLILIIV